MVHLSRFGREFVRALRKLLPIVAVVVVFQLLVFRRVPADPLELVTGLLIVAAWIAVFLQGLDLSISRSGKILPTCCPERALRLLLPFDFAIGLAASIGPAGPTRQ